ncbi:MAG: sulfite exporter TauE/SafE family protein [Patescibacteria group bacterium]
MSNKKNQLSKTKTYYVTGMHCQACELLLEKKLSKMEQVNQVDASLENHAVTVSYHPQKKAPSIDSLNETFAPLGYTLTNEPVGQVRWDHLTIAKAFVTLFVLWFIYFIIEDSGMLARVSLTEQSALPMFFVFGLIAGISSCAALVGGVLLSLSRQWNQMYGGERETDRVIPFALFNIGRIASYIVLGGLLGLVGSYFQLSLSATAILVIGVSAVMIIVALQMLGVPGFTGIKLQIPKGMSRFLSNEQNFQGKYMPFLAGAATFFLPCGFTLLAQTIALTTGSFIASALMMGLFALGTLPTLIAISFSSMKFQTNPQFADTFNLVVGILIFVFGIYTLNSQLNILGLPSLNDAIAAVSPRGENQEITNSAGVSGLDSEGLGVELTGEGTSQQQQVYMRAEGFEYFPKRLTLMAGVPTTVSVENIDVIGCAQAMYLQGLYDDVVMLNTPTSEVTFTPEPGTYKISCTMGMVDPVIVSVQ